jgi:hypothetical protein
MMKMVRTWPGGWALLLCNFYVMNFHTTQEDIAFFFNNRFFNIVTSQQLEKFFCLGDQFIVLFIYFLTIVFSYFFT